MKKITNIRKAVCIMANQLKKADYSLSEIFKKAWRHVHNDCEGSSFSKKICLSHWKENLIISMTKTPFRLLYT